MQEEPVEIEFRILHNVETEGAKVTEGIDNIEASAASAKGAVDGLGKSVNDIDKKGSTGGAAGVRSMTKQFNGLNYSVQQVARELPNIAISPQMFIMAISNNLPILQDELVKTKQRNDALRASGQKTVPIFKQIISSIFSWQTALVAVITVATVFGKQIADWAKKALDFSDAAKLSREEVKKLKEELAKSMGTELGKMDQMFDKLKNAKDGTDDYLEAKAAIIKQYGDYLSGMDDEIATLNDVEGAYRAITAAIKEQAREKALSDVYAQEGEKLITVVNEQYEIIRKNLVAKFGEAVGGELFDRFFESFEESGRLNESMENIFAKFDRPITMNVGYGVYGASMGTYTDNLSELRAAIEKITDAQEEYNGKIKDARAISGAFARANEEENSSLVERAELELRLAKALPDYTEEQLAAKNKAVEEAQRELDRLKDMGTAQQKENEARLKSEEELADAELETKYAARQASIDVMRDGYEKELAQMKLNHAKELDELDKQKKEFAKKQFEADPANKYETFSYSDLGLSSEQESLFASISADILSKQGRELADFFEKSLDEYGNYADGIRKINKEFDQKREEISLLGGDAGNLARIEQDRALALQDLTESFAKKNEDYELWLSGVTDLSLKTLTEELYKARSVLMTATDGFTSYESAQVPVLLAKIDALEKRIAALNAERAAGSEAKNKKTAAEEVERWKELSSALGEVKEAFKEIGEEVGGLAGDIMSSAGEIAGTTLQMINSIVTLANWSVTSTQMAAEGAAASIIAVERASVILTVIATAIQIISKIVSVIRDNTGQGKETKELEKAAANIESSYEAINKQLEKRVELIEDATAAEAKYLDTLSQQTISEQKRYIEQQLGGMMGTNMFDKKGKSKDMDLGEVMNWAGLNSIAEFIEWWNEGGYLELLAKGYTIANEESWQSIIDSYNDLGEAAEESAEAAQEAITGITFDKLKDSLDSLVTDFETTGEDIKESFTDTIEEGILAWVKSSYMTDALRQWYEDLTAAFGDGSLSAEEYAQLEAMYADIYDNAKQMYDTAADAIGLDSTSTREAAAEGIAKASQDSVDEFNGRMTAIQQMMRELRDSAGERLSLEREASIYRNLVGSLLGDIAQDTKYLKHLETIKNDVADIKDRGVKIKG